MGHLSPHPATTEPVGHREDPAQPKEKKRFLIHKIKQCLAHYKDSRKKKKRASHILAVFMIVTVYIITEPLKEEAPLNVSKEKNLHHSLELGEKKPTSS